MKKTAFITIALLSLVFLFDYFTFNEVSEKYSEDYLNESLVLATSAYATSRVINAGVSTLQESTISMSPWGIGITVPPGQVLDPINDATERLSDLCVQSIGLLGVQRILLEVVNEFTFVPLYLGLVFLLLICFTKQDNLSVILLKFVLLLALLRITTPIMCSIGIAANDRYFTTSIEGNLENLSAAKEIVTAEFNYQESSIDVSISTDDDHGTFETIKLFFTELTESIKKQYTRVEFRMQKASEATAFLKDHSMEIISDLTSLFAAILGKVVVQVFLLPLTSLALIRWIFQQLTESSLDKFVVYLRVRLVGEPA